MDSYLMFLNCPAYMDNNGAARCGLPAEVHYRYTMNSTDGPLESAKIKLARAATTSTGPSNASPCQSSRLRPPYQPAPAAACGSKRATASPMGRRTIMTPRQWPTFRWPCCSCWPGLASR